MKIIAWISALLFLFAWLISESIVGAAFVALLIFGVLCGIRNLALNSRARR